MNEDMTELLMGKFLDGEITPAEQQFLEAEMRQNPQARQLMRELEQLHELTEQVLASELIEKGRSAEETFKRAAQQTPLRHEHRRIKLNWWQRAAAGAAAALLVCLSIYVAFSQSKGGPIEIETQQPAPQIARLEPPGDPDIRSDSTIYPVQPVRYGPRPDFYFFQAPDGAKWLIENTPQNQVRRAVYNGDIH